MELLRQWCRRARNERGKKTHWADEVEEDLNYIELELNQVGDDDDKDISSRAWDDVKDIELDTKKVRKARRLQMDSVKTRKLYKYAKRAEAVWSGHKIIGVKWADTSKGGDDVEY